MPRHEAEMTRIAVTDPHQVCEEVRNHLEGSYIEWEALNTQATRMERAAAIALSTAQMTQADAAHARADATRAQIQFQADCAEHFDVVAREPLWMPPYRNVRGEVELASPMTSRDQRVAAGVMHKSMVERADPGQFGGMFDSGENGQ